MIGTLTLYDRWGDELGSAKTMLNVQPTSSRPYGGDVDLAITTVVTVARAYRGPVFYRYHFECFDTQLMGGKLLSLEPGDEITLEVDVS